MDSSKANGMLRIDSCALVPVLVSAVCDLWAIKRVAHLLHNFFTATDHPTRLSKSDELIIKPGIWLAEVRIDAVSHKDQVEIAICILGHFASILPIEDSACRPILDPIIELYLCDIRI